MPATPRKKLIEVALPLVEINDASAYDKMPGIGPHPKSVHKWWAPLPLPSARAILFASLVDDPQSDPNFASQSEEIQDQERERLFKIIKSLLQKKIHEYPEVFEAARAEIERSCDGNIPAMLDPFAGSGAIPIEGQRLGLKVYASDLNPIPVMINKVLIEILPHFADHPPVNPEYKKGTAKGIDWQNAKGLAADLRYYSKWMLDQAREKIGKYYPTAPNGEQVIGWLWARTVKCSNPACGATMPLISTYNLSTKKNNLAWLEPIVDRNRKTVTFNIASGKGKPEAPPKVGRGAKFRCLVCGDIAPDQHVKKEALAHRMGNQLIAIIADGGRGRVYYSPNNSHESIALQADPDWRPIGELADDPRNIWCKGYGLTDVADLFTNRQLLGLGCLSDLLPSVRAQIIADAGVITSTQAYANALITLLAFGLDRAVDFNSSLCRWSASNEKIMNMFGRQAIPMVWDYAESNILSDAVGSWLTCSQYVADCVEVTVIKHRIAGKVQQLDAAKSYYPEKLLISTDPPYYDNISYAGLSDVFYVWLRRSLGDIYPEIFETMLVPKSQELIADPERFGGQVAAREHFETGFQSVFASLYKQIDPRFPMTVYYAFKQSDAEDEDNKPSNVTVIDLTTGWETLLSGLISSGFQITATWPIRASQAWRLRSMGANALASYIILACRPRPVDAPTTSRRQFVDSLRRELPTALKNMLFGNIAPVDLAQASIGPGMAIYSRYSKVLEADGSALTVRAALGLINQELDAYLAEQDGSIDPDTRFAVAWFEQFSFNEGEFGHADVLARAKNTSVAGVEAAGVVVAGRGKVKLKHWTEYDPGTWDPQSDRRPTVWEAVHHMIERLNHHGEEGAAGLLLRMNPEMASEARALAYRLYSICERKGWAEHALEYNKLVVSWTGVADQAAEVKSAGDRGDANKQLGLFE